MCSCVDADVKRTDPLWACPLGLVNYLVPYGAASGNRQLGQHREIVAAVLRQLNCDLCGDSGGAHQRCFLCGVSPYGAASGNRQQRQHREILALMPLLLLSYFCSVFQVNSPVLERLSIGAQCHGRTPAPFICKAQIPLLCRAFCDLSAVQLQLANRRASRSAAPAPRS